MEKERIKRFPQIFVKSAQPDYEKRILISTKASLKIFTPRALVVLCPLLPKMRRKHRAGSDDTALWSKSWIAGLPGLCLLCKWVSSRQDDEHWKVLLWHLEHDRLWRHCVIQSVEHLFPETHSPPDSGGAHTGRKVLVGGVADSQRI